MTKLPIGAQFSESIRKRFQFNKRLFYRGLILTITFFIYVVYHLTRRPISVVKSVWDRKNCSDAPTYDDDRIRLHLTADNRTDYCDWEPFKGEDGTTLLGLLDTSFLVTYAIFMFVSGYIAERSNLRYFLSINLVLIGIFSTMMGLAFYFDIHKLYYFIIVQILLGIAQTTGWPSVVAAVSYWYGSAKKGLVFGIWNSHTSIGNIAGAAIAGAFVEKNWGFSFIVPGIISCVMAVITFLFMVPRPSEVGVLSADADDEKANSESDSGSEEGTAISFIDAVKIPGVIEFSICLFFTKLVSYTFLFWLPLYIAYTTDSSGADSAYLSITFDIGGIFGGIVAGYLADKTGANALTCNGMILLAIPSLCLYWKFGTKSNYLNEVLLAITGFFVNAPYALITTAVSAELGGKVQSKSALATVTAIIDGTGSIGAAVGPALTGVVSKWGWENVFYMVMFSDALACLSLLRICYNEVLNMRSSSSSS